ncbi:MAG: hypothetical protein E2P02_03790 [Acidobacteria bacterium]|nr:MAG: hypothetical protein E2P02_03790 [Acidobacteriota bacterium]
MAVLVTLSTGCSPRDTRWVQRYLEWPGILADQQERPAPQPRDPLEEAQEKLRDAGVHTYDACVVELPVCAALGYPARSVDFWSRSIQAPFEPPRTSGSPSLRAGRRRTSNENVNRSSRRGVTLQRIDLVSPNPASCGGALLPPGLEWVVPMDFDAVKNVLTALEREEVQYVVFGAVAINLLGLPRATEDLDIFVAPEPDNIERLKKALQSVYPDDTSIEEITAEDLLGDYPAVQYVPPDGDFYLDILTRLGEAFRYEDISSQRLDFDGLTVSVATPEILYRMKKDTVRPKDWGDAEALRRRFDLDED